MQAMGGAALGGFGAGAGMYGGNDNTESERARDRHTQTGADTVKIGLRSVK